MQRFLRLQLVGVGVVVGVLVAMGPAAQLVVVVELAVVAEAELVAVAGLVVAVGVEAELQVMFVVEDEVGLGAEHSPSEAPAGLLDLLEGFHVKYLQVQNQGLLKERDPEH